jgi:hypothetical protein
MTKLIGALAAVVVALGVTMAVPGVASADNLGGVITADMNSDGILDQVQLGRVGGPTSTTCTVTVSNGKAGGGFRQPQVHTYTDPTNDPCPDMAVAVKLGNETKPDLLTAASFGFGLLVLHNFLPAATPPGVTQPTWLRTVDLNGDGRQDILLWSSQVSELTSLFNTAQGVLVRGPISVGTLSSGGNNGALGPQYALADFNGDGGQDMLLSLNQQIPGPGHIAPILAEVFFGNGQGPTVLATTSDFFAIWTVFSIDLDANGIPDAGIIEKSGTGVTTVQYFHNDGVGNFKLVPTP